MSAKDLECMEEERKGRSEGQEIHRRWAEEGVDKGNRAFGQERKGRGDAQDRKGSE